MEKELKPCPFCGGKAKLNESKAGGGVNCHTVIIKCTQCTAKMDGVEPLDTKKDLRADMVGKWNKRV